MLIFRGGKFERMPWDFVGINSLQHDGESSTSAFQPSGWQE